MNFFLHEQNDDVNCLRQLCWTEGQKKDFPKTKTVRTLINNSVNAMEFLYPVGLCVNQRNRPVARVFGMTVDHNLVIVMAPDRVFNGMSEFLDHMIQQRPRTRNARHTLQQQLHVLCTTQQSMRILPYRAVQSWLPDKAVVHTSEWLRSMPYTGLDAPVAVSYTHLTLPTICSV